MEYIIQHYADSIITAVVGISLTAAFGAVFYAVMG